MEYSIPNPNTNPNLRDSTLYQPDSRLSQDIRSLMRLSGKTPLIHAAQVCVSVHTCTTFIFSSLRCKPPTDTGAELLH